MNPFGMRSSAEASPFSIRRAPSAPTISTATFSAIRFDVRAETSASAAMPSSRFSTSRWIFGTRSPPEPKERAISSAKTTGKLSTMRNPSGERILRRRSLATSSASTRISRAAPGP